MFGLGLVEIGIIVVALLFLFGPAKLPQLGKSLGGAISGFKKELTSNDPPAGINK